MIVVSSWTGREAAWLRAALRMPITEFAARLGIAERSISLWERKGAGVTPVPQMQQILDVALEQASDAAKDRFALLCAQGRETADSGGNDDVAFDMNRRELLRLLAITGPALAFAPPGSSRAVPLDDYAQANARLWRVYAQAAPKRSVLPLVNAHLSVITSRLREATGQARTRLCSLASDVFQLAGEIFFDGNRYTDAAHCYTLAADAAREAGDADLWSCAMTRHSFIYVYGQEFPAAVPMLDAATGIAKRGDRALPTWQWASCVRAQALAGLKDERGCQWALDDAQTVLSLPGARTGMGWLRFDGSRLSEERGGCYTALGRPDLATGALEAALSGELSPRRRGSVHVDLAAIGLQRGDLDEFADHADTALRLAGETGSGYVARRLRGLQLAGVASDSRVQDVRERIVIMEAQC
jgi:tetratricopeptide (TPR) repeat protein